VADPRGRWPRMHPVAPAGSCRPSLGSRAVEGARRWRGEEEGRAKGVAGVGPSDEAGRSPIRALGPDGADEGREDRSMPLFLEVKDSQLGEDRPPREAGVGLLASGQARRRPSLVGAVRVAPRRDGCSFAHRAS
jgi:hypothetical protein